MMKFLTKLAQRILKDEIANYESQITDLTKDRDGYLDSYVKANGTIAELKNELNKKGNCMLPVSLVAEVVKFLPDANFLAIHIPNSGDEYIMNSGSCSFGRYDWKFEIKIDKVVRISDKKIELIVNLTNTRGVKTEIHIPATLVTYHNIASDIKGYVWNMYGSGIDMITDDVYRVVDDAVDVWANCLRDLFC